MHLGSAANRHKSFKYYRIYKLLKCKIINWKNIIEIQIFLIGVTIASRTYNKVLFFFDCSIFFALTQARMCIIVNHLTYKIYKSFKCIKN